MYKLTQEAAIAAAKKINNELKEKIEYTLLVHLGVKTYIEAEAKQGYNSWYIVVKDRNDDVLKKMTGNKILRQLFETANLYMDAYYFEEEQEINFDVQINYDHNYGGGSNGHRLMSFSIMLDTNKVIIRK